ncbi:hypothetical protein [Pseudaeromonas paramecii]|uniref:DUF2732 family protein n=1 Tax=Pseudaeromonas paramecii TaxID=2138166 RepID=A0ABP8PVW0_9GAMM
MHYNSLIALERASETVRAVRHLLVVMSSKKLRDPHLNEAARIALAMQLKEAEQDIQIALNEIH